MASEVRIDIVAQDNFSGVLGNFGNIITGIASAVSLAGDAFRAFSGFALDGLEAIGNYERLSATLQTLVASQMLQAGAADTMAEAMGSAGLKAEQLLQWVQELAINSPFTSEGVADAFRMAMAYGFTTDEAQRLTQALINFAAGSGATEESMSRIALALGQIEAKGKLSGQEILQLVNAGLAVDQILAEAFGKSTAEIVKMREQGLIPASDAIEAITVYLETNFAGAAERQAFTWAGLLATFQDLKEIGLREFFMGLSEVLQPVAVAFSTWLQDEGLDKIRILGDIMGGLVGIFIEMAGFNVGKPFYDLGVAIGQLSEHFPLLEDLGRVLREMQLQIDLGKSPFLSLKEAIDDLAISWEGSPLEGIITAIQTFIDTAENEGLGAAFKELFSTIFSNIDFQVLVQTLINNIAVGLGSSDGTALGQSLAQFINGAFITVLQGLHILVNQVDWKPLGTALGTAIGQVFEGMSKDPSNMKVELLGNAIGEAIWDAIKNGIRYVLDGIVDLFVEIVDFVVGTDSWRQIGQAVMDGIVKPINEWDMKWDKWLNEHIIDPVKKFLGISSPSTIFLEIGKNIIQGLVNGIESLVGWATTTIAGIVATILAPFKTILDLLGIDTSFLNVSTGTTGSHSTGGTTTGSTPGGSTLTGTNTVINQYFQGANIYVGSWDEIAYDCIYPNPFVTATSGQLGTSGGGTIRR